MHLKKFLCASLQWTFKEAISVHEFGGSIDKKNYISSFTFPHGHIGANLKEAIEDRSGKLPLPLILHFYIGLNK